MRDIRFESQDANEDEVAAALAAVQGVLDDETRRATEAEEATAKPSWRAARLLEGVEPGRKRRRTTGATNHRLAYLLRSPGRNASGCGPGTAAPDAFSRSLDAAQFSYDARRYRECRNAAGSDQPAACR